MRICSGFCSVVYKLVFIRGRFVESIYEWFFVRCFFFRRFCVGCFNVNSFIFKTAVVLWVFVYEFFYIKIVLKRYSYGGWGFIDEGFLGVIYV